MSERAWYRSLYWRIGAGFVLFLALIAAAQTGALVWLTSRVDYGPPSPSVTRVVADELSAALTENPKLDLAEFFKKNYEEHIPMVAVMRDGRVVSSNGVAPPEDLVTEARARVSAGGGRGFGGGPPRFRGGGPGGGGPRGGAPAGAGPEGGFAPPNGGDPGSAGRGGQAGPGGPGGPVFGGGRRGGQMARGGPWSPIIVNAQVVGDIVANPQSTWQQFGPTLLIVGFALVALGTTSAAFLIFGPVRGRLRSLEDATRRVGAGDLTARAREDGGDEVAELAAAFNQMTGDLSARADQLSAADRQRRMLFADVSHELMTPLTAMRGYLETLAMSGITIDAATRARYLSIIGDETHRMEHIVGDLLELARLEGARESIDRQDVTLENLFGRVMARHERDAEQNQVELTTAIEPGAEIVQGDPLRLEQALQNLAANAFRHTPPGGRVELRAESHEQHVVIKVRDTGTGIAPEHLPHVFDRFYKVDPSRSGEKPGSGLGLSIVKAIVERHGGTVSATSQPGLTEFTIRLPL